MCSLEVFLFHASTTSNKEKRYSMSSRSHPDAPWCPFSALSQIIDGIVTDDHQLVFSENEIKTPDRFNSPFSYYSGFLVFFLFLLFIFFTKKKTVGRHARGRTSLSSSTIKHDIKHKVTDHELCLVKTHRVFEYWMLAAMPTKAALKLSRYNFNV